MTREQKQKTWAAEYKARAKKFYEALEAKGINTSADAVVRVESEMPLIIQNQAILTLGDMVK